MNRNYVIKLCAVITLYYAFSGNALGIWFCGFRFFPKRSFLAPPPPLARRRRASALCKTKDYIAVQRASIGTDARFINFM